MNPTSQSPTTKVAIEAVDAVSLKAVKKVSLEAVKEVSLTALETKVEATTTTVNSLARFETTVGTFKIVVTPLGARIESASGSKVLVTEIASTITAGVSKIVVACGGTISVDNGMGSSVKMIGPAMKIAGAVVSVG